MDKDAGHWRERAQQRLPQFRDVIRKVRSHGDLWQSFKEILSEAGVDERQQAAAESIYDYAWWCVAESGDADLAVEVETYFYEDLPVYDDFKEQLPRFISPAQFDRLESFFKYRLGDDEYAAFRSHYLKRRDIRSP